MYVPSYEALVVAPPTLYRQGLVGTLREVWPNLGITLATDCATVPRLLYQRAYAVVILDAELLTCLANRYLSQLRTIRSNQPLLLFTGGRLPPALRQYLVQAGPWLSWLPRHVAPAAVVAGLTPYLSGQGRPADTPPVSLARHPRPATAFSRRELEVLRLVVDDHCNQEIADQLCLSVRTVESHRRALLHKTGAKTLVGLVVQALREGWVGV
ncbi:helix-turn-helix transcriptional regulator [Hymenobacter rubripertinctus]|uniref:DNA-binding response regulator n=1 Tax=Hymenobacter rubripertinctus TaxID=2029981 RepID=A0A418QRB4_9BACT|nr:LuxR C-terminal-related transcriptional regulator [Hymenobacter rubripertinctus]RIY07817.1 DNA-binding response regulator [Hymenobacter rubripertinctus]